MTEKLEELLKTNWTKFIDRNLFLVSILQKVQEMASHYRTEETADMPSSQLKVSVTSVEAHEQGVLSLAAEFTVPIGDSVAIGTHFYHLTIGGDYHGELRFVQSIGTIFVNKT